MDIIVFTAVWQRLHNGTGNRLLAPRSVIYTSSENVRKPFLSPLFYNALSSINISSNSVPDCIMANPQQTVRQFYSSHSYLYSYSVETYKAGNNSEEMHKIALFECIALFSAQHRRPTSGRLYCRTPHVLGGPFGPF